MNKRWNGFCIWYSFVSNKVSPYSSEVHGRPWLLKSSVEIVYRIELRLILHCKGRLHLVQPWSPPITDPLRQTPNRTLAVSMGRSRPTCPRDAASCRRQNCTRSVYFELWANLCWIGNCEQNKLNWASCFKTLGNHISISE